MDIPQHNLRDNWFFRETSFGRFSNVLKGSSLYVYSLICQLDLDVLVCLH